MKQKYVILLVTLLLLIVGVCVSPYINYTIMYQDMSSRELLVESSTKSNLENQFIRFEFDNEDIRLIYHPEFVNNSEEIYYMDINSEFHHAELSGFDINNEMSGSFLTMAKSSNWDINEDGTIDEVIVCAKVDTNETQGYSEYSNRFEDSSIPLEIIRSGETDMTLLKNGVPYSGDIKMYTAHGGCEKLTISDGNIPFVDVRDQRNGVVIMCESSPTQTYIATYISEEHILFGIQHAKNMVTFIVFAGCVVVGIVIVLIIRKLLKKCSYI